MSKFDDQVPPRQEPEPEAEKAREETPAAPYRVGNKKPPLHSRFKSGESGNPKGRPKGRSDFGTTLMKEFYKTVPATKNGKAIKVTNEQVFVASFVKAGITQGPQAKALLLKHIEQQQAREAAAAEARKRLPAAEPEKPFSWSDEHEKLYRQLEEAQEREKKKREKQEKGDDDKAGDDKAKDK